VLESLKVPVAVNCCVCDIVTAERLGLTATLSEPCVTVMVAEAYAFDAVSQLGYLAARTQRAALVSGILPIFSRTPTLTAMLEFSDGSLGFISIAPEEPVVARIIEQADAR